MKNNIHPQVVAALLVGFSLLSAGLAAADWRVELRESLRAKYTLTETGKDRITIAQPGTVIVIQKGGISGNIVSLPTYTVNKVIAGDVSQAAKTTMLP